MASPCHEDKSGGQDGDRRNVPKGVNDTDDEMHIWPASDYAAPFGWKTEEQSVYATRERCRQRPPLLKRANDAAVMTRTTCESNGCTSAVPAAPKVPELPWFKKVLSSNLL